MSNGFVWWKCRLLAEENTGRESAEKVLDIVGLGVVLRALLAVLLARDHVAVLGTRDARRFLSAPRVDKMTKGPSRVVDGNPARLDTHNNTAAVCAELENQTAANDAGGE